MPSCSLLKSLAARLTSCFYSLSSSGPSSSSHFLVSPELKGGWLTLESNANSRLTKKAACARWVFLLLRADVHCFWEREWQIERERKKNPPGTLVEMQFKCDGICVEHWQADRSLPRTLLRLTSLVMEPSVTNTCNMECVYWFSCKEGIFNSHPEEASRPLHFLLHQFH